MVVLTCHPSFLVLVTCFWFTLYNIGGLMAWNIVIADNGAWLPDEQQKQNALEIYGALYSRGWSFLAVCGALGNMTHESGGLNPGACERGHGIPVEGSVKYGGGLGLIQWTDYPQPYTATYNHPLLWNANRMGQPWYSGNFQCELLNLATDDTATHPVPGMGSTWGWLTSSSYPSLGFNEYKGVTGRTPEEVAEIFFYCMESHGFNDGTVPARQRYARFWYDYLLGGEPEPPVPPSPDPDPDPPIPVARDRRGKWIYYIPHPNLPHGII